MSFRYDLIAMVCLRQWRNCLVRHFSREAKEDLVVAFSSWPHEDVHRMGFSLLYSDAIFLFFYVTENGHGWVSLCGVQLCMETTCVRCVYISNRMIKISESMNFNLISDSLLLSHYFVAFTISLKNLESPLVLICTYA